jgi:LuxR family maltose regulon positive regulatory protein
MIAPLLNAKFFIPPLRANQVLRRHLIARLDEGQRQGLRLTLISAPAGYGKTMLVAEWVRQHGRPVAWLSLDDNDNDPIRFWTYVVAALRQVQPQVGETALAMLRATPPPAIDVALTALINDVAALPAPFVLVLDDYQAIQSQPIHAALAFLIDYLPPSMHLVMITRIDPPLNIARLRVRQQMTELRANDLRFTPDEAALFLNKVMGLGLLPQDIAALEARTEGWIAGLQVAAVAMEGHGNPSAFIEAFAGSHRYILSYLIEEVFLRQPEQVQTFLLRTSILDRLSGSLCDALTGQQNGQETLERLEASNLFIVPLDDEQRWYRYHHLFSDVLRARLQREYQAHEVQALHHAASRWYEQHGQIDEAVRHALLVEDAERTADLVERFAGDWMQRSELATLLRWLELLPDSMVHTSPRLSMIYAWGLLASSQIEAVEPRLRDVERSLGMAADQAANEPTLPASLRGALGEVLCVRANLAFHHFDLPRVLSLSQQALACLTDDVETGLFHTQPVLRGVVAFNVALAHEFSGDVRLASEMFAETIALSRRVNNLHLVLMARSHMAQMQRIQGQLRQAVDTYHQAIRFAQESTLPPSPLLGMAYTGLGDVFYEWNELDRARSSLDQGIDLARPWSNWETLVPGYLGLARLLAVRGDWTGAEKLLAGLVDSLPELQSPWGTPLIQAHQAQLWARQGKLSAAAGWVRQTGLTVDGELAYSREPETIILAQVLIALGRADGALRLLARLQAAAEAGERTGRVIEVLIGQALAFQVQDRGDAALAALKRALTLAAPEGYVRTFVDKGQAMADLLSQVDVLPAYVARLLAAFQGPEAATAQDAAPGKAVAQPAGLIEPLSDRELELLRLIAAGLTNQDIAEALTISVNTVKTHARHVFAKLGVRTRTEAAARARELGLL